MAKKSDELTIDYRTIMSIPPSDRRALVSSGTIDPLLGVLTPGQRVALFPDYYKGQLSSLAGQRGEFGGSTTVSASGNPQLAAAVQNAGTTPNSRPARQVQEIQMSGTREKPGENSEFYDRAYQAVYKAAVEKGVPNPEVIARLGAAQAAIETGYGKHQVGNNYFGIKGKGVTAATQEFRAGRMVNENAEFATYGGLEDSAAGYVEFLQKNKRYAGVLAATSVDQAIAIQGTTGYATDPEYGSKLASINSNYGVGAPTATPVYSELPNDLPVGSVVDDTAPIGGQSATAIPEQVLAAGGIASYDLPPSYNPDQGVPNNFNRIAIDPNSQENVRSIVPVTTPYGTINVRKDAAAAYSGFYGDLSAAGFPMSSPPGSFNIRRKQSAGPGHNPGEGWSQHSYGNATDIGNQAQWNKEQIEWFEKNPGALDRIKAKWGMKSPAGDDPHMEFMGAVSPDALAQLQNEKQNSKPVQTATPASDTAAPPAPTTAESYSLVPDAGKSYGYSNEQLMKYVRKGYVSGASVNEQGQIVFTDKEAAAKQLSNYGVDMSKILTPNAPVTSMAAGGVLTEPHTAVNNRTGEVVNLGEVGTGGEAVVPMNKIKANEVGQQPYQMPVTPQIIEQPKSSLSENDLNKGSVSGKNATGQQIPTTSVIAADHPMVPPSARKAYADAGLEHRFNNFSSIGTQYRSFGI